MGPEADRDLDAVGCDLGRVRSVSCAIHTTGEALAAGVLAAEAPVVVCAEEHSYPAPGWAQALIGAHRGPWVAVGGVLENANPDTMLSWAHLFTDFGPAVSPAPAGEARELPGHHTAYKRAALLAYGDRLGRCLEVEWMLQEDLRRAGGRLYLEPRAVSRHLNVSRLASVLRSEFHGGRSFAANRAWISDWSLLHRLALVPAIPLVFAVRVRRVLRDVRRARPSLLPRLLPALSLGLAVNCLGQAVGCSLGHGGAARRRVSIELRRHRHLHPRDRAARPRATGA